MAVITQLEMIFQILSDGIIQQDGIGIMGKSKFNMIWKDFIAWLVMSLGVLTTFLGTSNLFENSITVKMVAMTGFAKQGFIIMGSIIGGGITLNGLLYSMRILAPKEKRKMQLYYFIPLMTLWIGTIVCIFIGKFYRWESRSLCGFLVIITFIALYCFIHKVGKEQDKLK